MSEYGFSCQWEMVGRLFIGIDSKRSSENFSDGLSCLRCRYLRRARFGGFMFWRFQEIAAVFQNLGQKRFEFLSAADFAGVKRHRVRIVIIHILHPLRAFLVLAGRPRIGTLNQNLLFRSAIGCGFPVRHGDAT